MKNLVTLLLLATVLAACSSEKSKLPAPSDPERKALTDKYEEKIGRYVYLVAPYDLDHRCLHVDDQCINCMDAVEALHCGIKRVDIDSLKEVDLNYCCQDCVPDSIYDMLKKLAQ